MTCYCKNIAQYAGRGVHIDISFTITHFKKIIRIDRLYLPLSRSVRNSIMYNEKDVIKEDIKNILHRNGLSEHEFKITVENGSSYDPNQIVGIQVWITIERNTIKKRYGLYRTHWPDDFETDLKNGYFN